MNGIRQDLPRTTLSVICLLLLIVGSLWVLLPFIAATVWATMIVVATWPLLESLQRRLGNRRGPAVLVMTLGMLLLLVIPLWAAIDIIAEHGDKVGSLAKQVAESGLPQPPEWVAKVPLVGKKLFATLSAWADSVPPASRPGWGLPFGCREVGLRPGGQSRRHADPVPAGRDPLHRHVLRRRIGGARRTSFRPAAGGSAG